MTTTTIREAILAAQSTYDEVLKDAAARIAQLEDEKWQAEQECRRLRDNVHCSVDMMLDNEAKEFVGYHAEQDVGLVVTRLCSCLTAQKMDISLKDADIARMGEALERCEWFKCDTCGRWWPMGDYIEDADGRLGMWTGDGDPQRCPACTAATMKTCPVCGWFMPINTTECDHCMGEGEE